MNGLKKNKAYVPVLVFFLGILILLPSIWSETSITGKDEYWLSLRTPMEMLERDSRLTPYVNGEPRLKKPPLLYWGILTNYKAFGIGLAGARIWGVLAGAGLALCTALFSRRLFGRSGLLAALITLSTIAVAVEGRRAMLDLPMATLVCFAVYFALRWGETGRWVWILTSAFSLGLSTMVKGPIGLLFFVTAALTALWVFGKWRFALKHWPQLLAAAGLFLLICLPWPLTMARMWPEFLGTVGREMGAERFGRIFIGSPFSALGGALGLVFPWSIVTVAAMTGVFRNRGRGMGNRALWLALWCFVGVAPFFFFRSFARYMVPLVPCVCVLCAEWLERAQGPWKGRIVRITAMLFGVAAAAAACFALWFRISPVFGWLSLLIAAIMIRLAFTGKRVEATAAFAAALFTCLMGGLYPSLGIGYMPSDIGDIAGNFPTAVYKTTQPSMLSVRLKRSVIQLWPETLKDAFQVKRFDGIVFMMEREAGGFEQVAEGLGVRHRRMGDFKTFYSRRTWVRFASEEASAGAWKAAFRMRSLEPLKVRMCYYRASPGEPPHE
ncbi:MAG: glycosyltransferase family 39 protein [Deltaproteobacteria bacterium]|nr:glycosyltransferase family 39 protein [Deltaproteobacteria bacterium]